MKKMNKKGFTIVELVIVIAVIGILATVLIPTFSNVIEKAQNSNFRQEARNKYLDNYDVSDSGYALYINKDQSKVIAVKKGNFVTVNDEIVIYEATGSGDSAKTAIQNAMTDLLPAAEAGKEWNAPVVEGTEKSVGLFEFVLNDVPAAG